jgi:recombination protein RecR
MSDVLERVIAELSRLPGVGRKTAQRLALHLLKANDEEVYALSDVLRELKERVRPCRLCNNATESELCGICRSPKRERDRILVVEEVSDLMAVEATHEYRGLYHVLMGAISPIDGIGPEDTTVEGLKRRVGEGGVSEVILATNPNVKGEATALYITRLLRPYNVKVTRIAYGMPIGGHLEYVDAGTLARSLAGRREME